MSSARELVLERDLVAPLLSPWLVPRDAMSLSETSKKCLREVRAGLSELKLNEKFGITDEHVITIVRCFPSLRLLWLTSAEDVTDAAVSAISNLSTLRELAISGCDLTDAGLAVLSEKLESLSLGDFSFGSRRRPLSDASLIATVRRLPNLRSLSISCTNAITGAAIAVLADTCVHLTELDMSYNHIVDDAAVASLVNCRRLESLNLDFCGETITSLVPVAEKRQLTFLDASDCQNITDASVLALARCPLKTLRLRGTEHVTDTSILALAQCHSLERLGLRNCYSITDASAVAVASCAHLLVLDLLGCRITDESVMAIAASCPMIHDISLGARSGKKLKKCEISDVSIVELASRCTRLRDVTLGSPYITDVSFKALARYTSCLRRLKVHKCQITDAGLIPIGQQCPQLHTLDLDSPFVTDDGIAALSGLRDLCIRDNGEVTAFAIAQLVVRSPDLDWFDTFGCPLWYPGDHSNELVRLLHEHLPDPEQSHPRIMEMLPGLTPREQS